MSSKLNLIFRIPIVGDTFDWKGSRKKKQGYVISEGNNVKELYLPKKNEQLN